MSFFCIQTFLRKDNVCYFQRVYFLNYLNVIFFIIFFIAMMGESFFKCGTSDCKDIQLKSETALKIVWLRFLAIHCLNTKWKGPKL